MNNLEKPTEKVNEIYLKCISRVKNEEQRAMLEKCLVELIQDEELYDCKGKENALSEFPQKNIVNESVSIEEMIKIYTYRMVGLHQPGRMFYNKLLNMIQICPFCGVRDVSTIDHYLPKSLYATTTVTPINLIPTCRDCNTNKDVCNVKKKDEEIWHPYYDNYNLTQWLFVKIKEELPPVVEYYVDTTMLSLCDIDKRKIQNSFDKLKLGSLYSKQAAKEMNDTKHYLHAIHVNAGKQSLMEHLEMMYESFRKIDINSWKTALYEALRRNTWYCDVYLDVDEKIAESEQEFEN